MLRDVTYWSSTHLALAHLVLSNPSYTKAYREASERGCYIYLDNGAFEEGVPLGANDILRAAEMIKADCLVAPDFPGERGEKTLLSTEDFLEFLEKEGLRTHYDVMAVPHSEAGDYDDFICVALDFMASEQIDVVGLSKLAIPTACKGGYKRWRFPENTRIEITSDLSNVFPQKRIHFLGMFSQPWEIQDLVSLREHHKKYLWLAPWTCDSSLPVWMGYCEMMFSLRHNDGRLYNEIGLPITPIDFDAPDYNRSMIIHNLQGMACVTNLDMSKRVPKKAQVRA